MTYELSSQLENSEVPQRANASSEMFNAFRDFAPLLNQLKRVPRLNARFIPNLEA